MLIMDELDAASAKLIEEVMSGDWMGPEEVIDVLKIASVSARTDPAAVQLEGMTGSDPLYVQAQIAAAADENPDAFLVAGLGDDVRYSIHVCLVTKPDGAAVAYVDQEIDVCVYSRMSESTASMALDAIPVDLLLAPDRGSIYRGRPWVLVGRAAVAFAVAAGLPTSELGLEPVDGSEQQRPRPSI